MTRARTGQRAEEVVLDLPSWRVRDERVRIVNEELRGPLLARYHHHLLFSHASAFKGRLEVCSSQAVLVVLRRLAVR